MKIHLSIYWKRSTYDKANYVWSLLYLPRLWFCFDSFYFKSIKRKGKLQILVAPVDHSKIRLKFIQSRYYRQDKLWTCAAKDTFMLRWERYRSNRIQLQKHKPQLTCQLANGLFVYPVFRKDVSLENWRHRVDAHWASVHFIIDGRSFFWNHHHNVCVNVMIIANCVTCVVSWNNHNVSGCRVYYKV